MLIYQRVMINYCQYVMGYCKPIGLYVLLTILAHNDVITHLTCVLLIQNGLWMDYHIFNHMLRIHLNKYDLMGGFFTCGL
jgi:hypothetical protein